MRSLLAVLVISATAAPLSAQSAPVAPAARPVVADSQPSHRPKPLNYFARSIILPGWGQAALGRKLTAGIFIGFEGIALGMALKASSELKYLRATKSPLVGARQQEREDWYVLVAVNHLFSALEAYVSANLFDFPGDLKMQSLTGGRRGIGFTVGIPHR